MWSNGWLNSMQLTSIVIEGEPTQTECKTGVPFMTLERDKIRYIGDLNETHSLVPLKSITPTPIGNRQKNKSIAKICFY